MSPSSAGGGTADKRGYRYEVRWTVLRGAIPVLTDRAISLTVEEVGLAGEGIEFSVQRSDGIEVHQAKRDRAGKSWTVGALFTAGVLDKLGAHLREPTTRAVFVSGAAAVDLQALARKAQLPDAATWRADLTAHEGIVADVLNKKWGLGDEETYDRLRRLTVHNVDEEFLVEDATSSMGHHVEGDEVAAFEVLAGYLTDNLHRPLGADEMWTELRARGFPPRDGGGDLATSEIVREATARYVSGVESVRPSLLPYLERPQVGEAVEALSAADGRRSVALVGPAGSGKSTVTVAVVARLREQGIVVAAVRLDEIGSAATADELGGQPAAGFGRSVAKALDRAANGVPAVLVVDQLDALSAISGRGDLLLKGVQQTLLQASLLSNVRVLVACRAHDLEHDRRLRQLLSGAPVPAAESGAQLLRIDVGELDDGQVDLVLNGLSLSPERVQPRLRSLIRNAFNLSLLARLVEDAHEAGQEPNLDILRTRIDLLRAVDEGLERRFRKATDSTSYGEIVQSLARKMSDAGQLSLAEITTLSAQPAIREALLSEGVLVLDSGRLRFFHQAYFEYAFALSQVGDGRGALDLVRGDTQDVVRRGQVRAILALERDAEPEKYRVDARSLLFESDVRVHIRAAVVDFIGDQSEPSAAEIELLRETVGKLDSPIRLRATRTLWRPGPASYLAQTGLLDRIARDAGHLIEGTTSSEGPPWLELDALDQLWLLSNLSRSRPEATARSARVLATDPLAAPTVVHGLLWIVFLAGPGAATEMGALFVELAATLGDLVGAAGGPPEGVLGRAIDTVFSDEGRRALHMLAMRSPPDAVDALMAWLSLADVVARSVGGTNLFDGNSGVIPSRLDSMDTLDRMVSSASVRLATALGPVLLAAMEKARLDYGHTPAGLDRGASPLLFMDGIWVGGGPAAYGDSSDELLGTLVLALRAAINSDAALLVLEELMATDLLTAHVTAAAVLADCPPRLAGRALRWAGDERVRGIGAGATAGWSWGAVLAHVVAIGTDEERVVATELVVAPYRNLDLRAAGVDASVGPSTDEEERRRAVEQLVAGSLVLRASLDRDGTVPTELGRRAAQLEAAFGPAPERPGPIVRMGFGQPALTDTRAAALTDEEWLSALSDADGQSEAQTAGTLTPSAFELEQQIRARAKDEPLRFARLLPRLPGERRASYAGAILAGIAQTGADLSEDVVLAIFEALHNAWSMPDRPAAQACLVIDRLSTARLPDGVVEMAVWTATQADDPRTETWRAASPSGEAAYGGDIMSSALNCARGHGVTTIARLLGSTHGPCYAELLVSTLEQVIEDPIEQVRVLVPGALRRLRRFDRTAARELLMRWLERATDDGLKAGDLPSLAFAVGEDDEDLACDVVSRMLRARIDSVMTTGGMLATYLAWREQDSISSARPATALLAQALDSPKATAGVAVAVAELRDQIPDDLAGAPQDPPVVGWSLLVRLLDDADEDVRSNARRFAHAFDQPLDAYRNLFEAVAKIENFDELGSSLLFMATRHPGELPGTILDIAERWLAEHTADAGDRSTAAAGSAIHITQVALDIHARSQPGSDVRRRSLDVFDRLIEVGADDIVDSLDRAGE